MTFYLPSLVIMIFVFWNLWVVHGAIARLSATAGSDANETKTFKMVISRMRIYVYIYAVIRVIGLLNRIQDLATGVKDEHDDISFLPALHAVIGPLQGVLNAIVYTQSK